MTTPAPAPAPVPNPPDSGVDALSLAWGAASIASTALCVYHGYKRNDSLGWGLLWGLAGGIFPVVAPAVALAQGFGEPGPEQKLDAVELELAKRGISLPKMAR
jgi:hypothetical protein